MTIVTESAGNLPACPPPTGSAGVSAQPRADERVTRGDVALLLGVLVLCLALRTAQLLAWPIFVDESLYIRAAQLMDPRAPATLLTLESPDYGGNPPLFAWLMAPLLHLLADPLRAARLTSALIGALGLLWTWATARTLWGRHAGLLAGFLYALCPFLLFYQRMALLDGLVATCGAGALYYAVRLARRGRTLDAGLLGLCLAAGLLTKILAASLLLLPLLAIVAAHPRHRRAVARGAVMAIVIGVGPFLCLLARPYMNTPYSFAFHGHLQLDGILPTLRIIADQAARWAEGLWLYLTPPVLLLAALGLWLVRRERMVLLVGAWAVLGSLPVVAAPNRLFVPRHFLYIAIPLIVLAARGVLALAHAVRGRQDARRPVWLILLVCGAASLLALPAIAADVTMIAAPTRTPLIPADRFQYVAGWPSGYMLAPVLSYLRRQAQHGRLTVVTEGGNPPRDMLRVALSRDTAITMAETDIADTHALRDYIKQAGRGGALYLMMHYTSDRPPPSAADSPTLLAQQGLLRLVLRARSLDGASHYDLYAATPTP